MSLSNFLSHSQFEHIKHEKSTTLEDTAIQEGGYNYEFVDGDPPDTCLCLICLAAAKEPYQASCCGKVYCKTCLDNYKMKKKKATCPNCRKELTNNYFKDTKTEREIKHLHIFCTNKTKNCKWVGPLKDIDTHLTVCAFQSVKCKMCRQLVLGRLLGQHCDEECYKRPYKCQHCHLEAEYDIIIGPHYEECPDVIIDCPNEGCSDKIKRCQVTSHRETCSKEVVPCCYQDIGCYSMVKRESLAKHEEQSMSQHLNLAVKRIATQNQHFNEKIKMLQAQFERAQRCLPLVTKVIKKKEEWRSSGFYTSLCGYKMSLWIYPNGRADGKGTHISCAVCLMPGEHDDTLEWPFYGEITVELLNQLEDKNHLKCVVTFNECIPLKYRQRVVGKQYGDGWCIGKFVAHSLLSTNYYLQIAYCENDTYYFRVSATVSIRSNTKPWLM